jgi:hypothetical protein
VALGLVLAVGWPQTVFAKTVVKAQPKAAKQVPGKPVWIQVGQAKLLVEIADTDSLRTAGLSNRQKMDWNAGMLFVFPDAAQRAFWMIDCRFDLDIAYLDGRGVVRDIQTMVIEPGVRPEALRRYPSATSDIAYALETNRGWMAANGVKIGQKVPSIAAFKTRN